MEPTLSPSPHSTSTSLYLILQSDMDIHILHLQPQCLRPSIQTTELPARAPQHLTQLTTLYNCSPFARFFSAWATANWHGAFTPYFYETHQPMPSNYNYATRHQSLYPSDPGTFTSHSIAMRDASLLNPDLSPPFKISKVFWQLY